MLDSLKIKRLHNSAMLPTRADEGAIGFDLYACTEGRKDDDDVDVRRDDSDILCMPEGSVIVGIGNAVAIPIGYYGQIAPRSGLAKRYGAQILGGIVDPSYRGEVKVMLHNSGNEPFTIKHGMRIAQLILIRAITPQIIDVDELDETSRGAGGFGSTGGF